MGFWYGGGERGANELVILATLIAAAVYGLNQIADRENDRLNQKNLPLARGLISTWMAWFISASAAFGAVVVGFGRSAPVGFATVAALALGWAYSLPPLRLKDKAVPALLANALGHGALVFIVGFLFARTNDWDWRVLLKALPYAIAYGAVYLATTVPDAEVDEKFGKLTFAVRFGWRRTMLLAVAGVFAAGALAIVLKEAPVFLTAAVSMPFYVGAAVQTELDERLVLRANKIAVLALALCAAAYFIPFFALVAATIAFAATYNRARLGVKYP